MARPEPVESDSAPQPDPSARGAGGMARSLIPVAPAGAEDVESEDHAQAEPSAASLFGGAISTGTLEPGQQGLCFAPQAFASEFPSLETAVATASVSTQPAGGAGPAAGARVGFACSQPSIASPAGPRLCAFGFIAAPLALLVADTEAAAPVLTSFARAYAALPRSRWVFSHLFPVLPGCLLAAEPAAPASLCRFGLVQPRWEPPVPSGADVIPFPHRGRPAPVAAAPVPAVRPFGFVQTSLVLPGAPESSVFPYPFAYAAVPLPAAERRAFASVQPARSFRPLASGFPFAFHFDSYMLNKPVRLTASDLVERVLLVAKEAGPPVVPALPPPATDLHVGGGSSWGDIGSAVSVAAPLHPASLDAVPGLVSFAWSWGPWTPVLSTSPRMRRFACLWPLFSSISRAPRRLRAAFAALFAPLPSPRPAVAVPAPRVAFDSHWASWPFAVPAAPVFRAFACFWAALSPGRVGGVSRRVGFDAAFGPLPPARAAFAWADVPPRLAAAPVEPPLSDPGPAPSTSVPGAFEAVAALDSTVTPAGGRSAAEEKPVAETTRTTDDAAAEGAEHKPNGQPAAEQGKSGHPTLASESESGVSLVEDSLQHGMGARSRDQGFDAATEKMLLDELKASGVDVGAYVEQIQKQLEVRRRSITAFELQLTVHQAVDSWRGSTREAAVRIHKMIDDTQQSGELLLKHAVYLEGVITLIMKRVQSFEAEMHSQLGRLGTEVDTSVSTANGKLGGVQAKIDGLDSALSARLDAHVEAATLRSKSVFDTCDASSKKFSDSLDESVKKIEAVQGALRTAQESVHNVETRSANVSRDLVQMDRSMAETLNAFRMPIVIPALAGGLLGAAGGAFVAILLWQLLAGG